MFACSLPCDCNIMLVSAIIAMASLIDQWGLSYTKLSAVKACQSFTLMLIQ